MNQNIKRKQRTQESDAKHLGLILPPKGQTHSCPAYASVLGSPHNLMLPFPPAVSIHHEQAPPRQIYIDFVPSLCCFPRLSTSYRAIKGPFQLMEPKGTRRKQTQAYHWLSKLEILGMRRYTEIPSILVHDTELWHFVRLKNPSLDHPLYEPGELRRHGWRLYDPRLQFALRRHGFGRHQAVGATEMHCAATKVGSPSASRCIIQEAKNLLLLLCSDEAFVESKSRHGICALNPFLSIPFLAPVRSC